MVLTTLTDYELTKGRRSEPAGILNTIYYTDLGVQIKSAEVVQ